VAVAAAAPGRFAGIWMTQQGLMELIQDGAKVRGRYAQRGTSEIEGTVRGRRLELRFKSFRGGSGWVDLATDGESISVAAQADGFPGWFGWRGRLAPEFARHATPKAGKLVDGSTDNLLTYTVRAPDGYKEQDKWTWPTVVILHGSNMNGRDYVATIANAWPDISRLALLIGINGETPSDIGPSPRFNYTYVNSMGRSEYRGLPGTDRETPALVAEALDELRRVYPVHHYLVGGHSQGGFLTYALLMHSPEQVTRKARTIRASTSVPASRPIRRARPRARASTNPELSRLKDWSGMVVGVRLVQLVTSVGASKTSSMLRTRVRRCWR
jgi:pimeloyl-ACP methyl ester carboxylesterase